MLYLYTLLLTLLYPFSIPILLYLARGERYRDSIPARFWLARNPPFSRPRRFWFHGCSFGELRSIGPILKGLQKRGELEEGVNITTITNTGFREGERLARRFNGECRYLPFDILIPFWGVPPERLVVLEAELWFLLFHWVRRHRGKVIILNGRISDRSWPRYWRFRWFYRSLFKNVELVLAQREVDRDRFLRLGAPRVEVVGNIKTLFTPSPPLPLQFQRPIIVAGSTHRGE
ncbi:MAG: glycosyltransferase N-terminal domain-containing protein, partial [Campylobacterales bacterium]